MKRVVIGGFISLVGSIWTLAILVVAGNNLTSGWSTPPGRLVTTLLEINMMPGFVISVALLLCGMGMMLIEYFRKDG